MRYTTRMNFSKQAIVCIVQPNSQLHSFQSLMQLAEKKMDWCSNSQRVKAPLPFHHKSPRRQTQLGMMWMIFHITNNDRALTSIRPNLDCRSIIGD